jgi:hypothetical protein
LSEQNVYRSGVIATAILKAKIDQMSQRVVQSAAHAARIEVQVANGTFKG